MKKFTVFFIAFLFSVSSFAAKITVTSGADSGAGTLREAVTIANNGDTIIFANTVTIPTFVVGIMITQLEYSRLYIVSDI